MQCSISGEAPQHPVVTKSGHIYEKSLLETYVKETGNDPVTGEPLSLEDDVITIQTNSTSGSTNGSVIHAKQPTLTSIPSLLSSLQSEWDSLILETFSLKQQLLKTRQELSSALYINDAAVRVAARLTKERDEARTELGKLAASLGVSVNNSSSGMDVDEGGEKEGGYTASLPNDIVEKITTKSKELASARKANSKKDLPEGYASVDHIRQFVESHKTKQLFSSVSHLSVNEETGHVLTGGGKSLGGIFSASDKALVGDNFHANGIITDVSWEATNNDAFVVATKSGTIDFYQTESDGTYKISQSITISSNSPLTTVASIPAGNLVVTSDKNGFWYILDLDSGSELCAINNNSEITSLAVHPDGELIAIGSIDGNIRIHKITESDFTEPAAIFATAEDSTSSDTTVTSLSFSENGYWLASSSNHLLGQAQIWNLRKLALLNTVSFESLQSASISSVKFDLSGQYLAAASSAGIEVVAYNKPEKSWISAVMTSPVGSIDIGWANHANYLVSITSKGSIHIFEKK